MRITVFDNHDSFTWNLAHDLERLDGVEVQVIREGSWQEHVWSSTEALVLSPGPGLPQERGQLMSVTAKAIQRGLPVLGVCLGMQALALHFGGRLVNLDRASGTLSQLGGGCVHVARFIARERPQLSGLSSGDVPQDPSRCGRPVSS